MMNWPRASLLKKNETCAIAPPMRSTCGMTSQPVVHTRVPSILRSGTTFTCMRAPLSSTDRPTGTCGTAPAAALP